MNFLCGKYQLNFNRPHVMGIVNVTPDSFSDGGKNNSYLFSANSYNQDGVIKNSDYKILCIGKNVDKTLRKYSLYRNKLFDVIHQPQARISNDDRFKDFKKCYKVCTRY